MLMLSARDGLAPPHGHSGTSSYVCITGEDPVARNTTSAPCISPRQRMPATRRTFIVSLASEPIAHSLLVSTLYVRLWPHSAHSYVRSSRLSLFGSGAINWL